MSETAPKPIYSDLDIEELRERLMEAKVFSAFLLGLIIGIALFIRKDRQDEA